MFLESTKCFCFFVNGWDVFTFHWSIVDKSISVEYSYSHTQVAIWLPLSVESKPCSISSEWLIWKIYACAVPHLHFIETYPNDKHFSVLCDSPDLKRKSTNSINSSVINMKILLKLLSTNNTIVSKCGTHNFSLQKNGVFRVRFNSSCA